MLQNTKGIVLRTVKYGESSVIATLFTEHFGMQSYLVQGVRKSKKNNAGLLQPSLLLDVETDHHPGKNLQRLRSFHPAFIYSSIQEDIVKNSVALFSVELLLRLLPEHAPFPELFDFSLHYFQMLDRAPVQEIANYPLYFLIKTGEWMGYHVKGNYSPSTPFLDAQEGGFTAKENNLYPIAGEDALQLDCLLQKKHQDFFMHRLSSSVRNALTDWYLEFLRLHSQQLGPLKSLDIIRTILH